MAVTVEHLEAQMTNGSGKVSLIVSLESDFAALTGVVQRCSKEAVPAAGNCKDQWTIIWRGDTSTVISTTELHDLVEAVGNYPKLTGLRVWLPLHTFDLAKMAEALRAGNNCLQHLWVLGVRTESTSGKEAAEQNVLNLLDQVCHWKLKLLYLYPKLPVEPTFFSKVALALPKLELGKVKIKVKQPVSPNGLDPFYVEELGRAFGKLQESLESNYSLRNFVVVSDDQELSALLKELHQDKFQLLLHLNNLGRKALVNLPPHLETWLELLPTHTQDHDDLYYYLRKNTWMFTPEIDLTKEIKQLQDQLEATKKRHRNQMEAKDTQLQATEKRHKTELEAKDLEIQRLQSLATSTCTVS